MTAAGRELEARKPPRCSFYLAFHPLKTSKTQPGQLWSGTTADTVPRLKILDLGCGGVRLLAGMLAFPEHLLRHFEYAGCEPTAIEIKKAKIQVAEIERQLLGQGKFSDVLSGVTFGTWDKYRSHANTFDFVYMINVLHHIPPEDFPSVFCNIARVIKDGGYLIIHDFYFADPRTYYDLSKYCDGCVFFGPQHVSSFFAMAPAQTGIYRTMRRGSSAHGFYDLFTFVLHFENELSKKAYNESVWYDDYFSYLEIPSGIHASLEDILDRSCQMSQQEWFEEYHDHVQACRDKMRFRWKYAFGLVFPEYIERWIKGGPPRFSATDSSRNE